MHETRKTIFLTHSPLLSPFSGKSSLRLCFSVFFFFDFFFFLDADFSDFSDEVFDFGHNVKDTMKNDMATQESVITKLKMIPRDELDGVYNVFVPYSTDDIGKINLAGVSRLLPAVSCHIMERFPAFGIRITYG